MTAAEQAGKQETLPLSQQLMSAVNRDDGKSWAGERTPHRRSKRPAAGVEPWCFSESDSFGFTGSLRRRSQHSQYTEITAEPAQLGRELPFEDAYRR